MQKKNNVFNRYYISFSDKLADISYNVYKNVRLFFSKYKPLSTYETYRFNENDPFKEKMAAKMPEGFNYIENIKEEGYLNLDYIDLYDYLPKENLEIFMKEMAGFVSRNNINPYGIRKTSGDIEKIYDFGQYFDGTAYVNLPSFETIPNFV